ncbi:MAG: tRNA lysidine(34) synthetase TilS [Oscillibacter sp.]|nr:tRNA lysidine(34) synthetase TilS [Oscillibacter sp.]
MAMGIDLQDARLFMRTRLANRDAPPPRLLAAVSGGLDSMCLLRFLLDWQAENGGTVIAAHFNHRLRGETADRDEEFVRNWCRENGVPFVRGDGDTRAYARHEGLSIEEAARRLRYGFLERTAKAKKCAWILTAHHADDNAETMLLNLIRGSGSRGLSGIPAIRGNIARPFLWETRAELERYAAARGIPHVEDETNQDPGAASRNLLRQRVLPALREINPRAVQNMGRTAAILERENALLDRQAQTLVGKARMEKGVLRMERRLLSETHAAIAEPAVLHLLESVCGRRRNLTAMDAEMVLVLCRKDEEKWELRLPYNLLVRGEGPDLAVLCLPPPPGPASIVPGRGVTFGEWFVTLGAEPGRGASYPVALPEKTPLAVSAWKSADRMTLPGARGPRSLKRLCADAGFRPWQRDALPVLRADGEPAAVPGVGVDAAFMPQDGKPVLYVTFTKEDGNAQ